MSYCSGFVCAVPTGNRSAYADHAAEAATLIREMGAVRIVEAWGDDVQDGELTDLRRAVGAEPSETVVFSWIEWPSKEACEVGHKAMMEDPRMEAMAADMPFDGGRLIYGGFERVSEAGAAGGAAYVDGALMPAPSDARASTVARSAAVAEALMEAGALRVVDGWGDFVPEGKRTDMRRAVAAQEGETVMFSWIEWPSRAVRDAGWETAMADPRLTSAMGGGGLDLRRMISGGFEILLDA